jgi:stage III sporulation protein AG
MNNDVISPKVNSFTEVKPAGDAAKPAKKPGIFARLKKIKHIEIIIAVIAVVIMLAIYFGSRAASAKKTSSSSAQSQSPVSTENYCDKMERQLKETLSKISGAGKADVIINWESSIEAIIAYITNSSNNSLTQTPQIINGNGISGPIILKEVYPKPKGVMIICQGADNIMLRMEISNAVSSLFDIAPDKIQVLPMKK